MTLKQAVQLALTHSATAVAAKADEQKAFASYQEARNAYIPSFSVGSGLGASWGLPLSLAGSAPSLFNLNAQSILYNPAQREFLKAARTDVDASKLQTKDQRNQVLQDTVATYTELVNWEQRLNRVQQEEQFSAAMERAVAARVQEGVDSQVDLNKAEVPELIQLPGIGEVLAEEVPAVDNLLTNKYDLRILGRLAKLFCRRRIDAVVTVGAGDKMFWSGISMSWLKKPLMRLNVIMVWIPPPSCSPADSLPA